MGLSQEKRKKTRKNRRTAYRKIGNGETTSAVTGRLTGRTNHNATERVLSSDESYG